MLGVLGEIRPVGEHEHRGRRQDQPPRVPVLRDERGAGEPDARVRQRDHEVRAEHLQRLHRRQRVLGERDDRERQPRADERARGHRHERRGPDARADLGRRRDHRVQHEHRDRRGERELRDVEGDLDRLGAADPEQDEQRPEDLGEDQLRRKPEQEADDQRDLRERQRVRAAAHVRMDDEDLGGGEAGGERPPRDVPALGVRLQRRHELQVQPHRGRGGHDDERPDRRGAAARSPARLPSVVPQSSPDQRRPDQRRPDHLRPDQRRPVHPFSPVPDRRALALRLREQVAPEDPQIEHRALEGLRGGLGARRRQRERAREVHAAGAVGRDVVRQVDGAAAEQGLELVRA